MNFYNKPDFYAKKAKQEGYVARSVYKLIEIDKKFRLFKPNQKIVDLGCAPGSWSQYVSDIITEHGLLIGIDYKKILINKNNFIGIQGDFNNDEIKTKIAAYSPFDGIISDMAPDTEGDNLIDCYKSSELVRSALDFSYNNLKKGGFFVAKIFQGGDEKQIMFEMKKSFKDTKWFKPQSSRKISYEIFLIGLDFISKPLNNNSNINSQLNEIEENYDGYMKW